MIYITGDTHGLINFDKLKKYFSKLYTTDQEFLIILGDTGIVWSDNEHYISEYSGLGPTVFFIDGNHDNFDLLNKFPVVEMFGAKCHRLISNVYHILRGEIITLNDLSFLCMGGATSIDKHLREEGISWWKDENITDLDMQNALNNLEKHSYKVDYVLTHCAPSKYVNKMFGYKSDDDTDKLAKLEYYTEFKHWYFGHYHADKTYKNFRCFYNDVLEIKAYKPVKKDIEYELLTKEEDATFLRNYKTDKIVRIREEDLPEWYYECCAYRSWYYRLKGITDIAFAGSPFDNHISKDSSIFLHYHGKLKKDEKERPVNREEWDSYTMRCSIAKFILAVDKYSPNINTEKIKAQINLVYDQYNGGYFFDTSKHVCVRPFPNIKTPIYKQWIDNLDATYEVVHGDAILSQFVELDRAKEYASLYVEYNLWNKNANKILGNENNEFIEAYNVDKDRTKWVYVRKINKDKL